ncbi:hypothetical protein AQUCO_00901039v1 [Aquilegia coerulea]|uniref:Pentacotripeptide-repeat region of PRORP domain-containing protein n=1 Tax=Aquilegia coerulea TaxID=218851 RepID=A0A2G5EGG4_AQUCA|nr:hypothetical protein AQUCO_00901039v1 [Aquilegia coerulea]
MSGYRIVVHHLSRLEKVNEALKVIENVCKMGWCEEGLALVNIMKSQHGYAPNDVTYNALIVGFYKAGEMTESRKLFYRMKEKGIVPTVVTYAAMIHGYCNEKKIKEALLLMDDILI